MAHDWQKRLKDALDHGHNVIFVSLKDIRAKHLDEALDILSERF